jgi:hypothetical protein
MEQNPPQQQSKKHPAAKFKQCESDGEGQGNVESQKGRFIAKPNPVDARQQHHDGASD